MWPVADDMIREAAALGVPVQALTDSLGERIRNEAVEKYGRKGNDWPLWDGPGDDPSFQSEGSWTVLPEFIGDAPCIIFWEPRTERKLLRFERGQDLVRVLEECHRMEFYVVDEVLSYMICYNEHDFLIASGSAAHWLEARLVRQARRSNEIEKNSGEPTPRAASLATPSGR